MQTLAFLPFARDGVDVMTKVATYRRILRTYSYSRIVADWDGWYEDRPGLYFVLDGNETANRSTIDRLASGLYFAHVLQDLR